MNIFFDTLKRISPFTKKELEIFNSLCKVKTIKKGEFFIREGSKSTDFAFVSKGLFRMTYLHEAGKEFTKSFFEENSFISSYSALIHKRDSYFSIEALEDSKIFIMNYSKLEQAFENNLHWYKFIFSLVQKGYFIKESREREFLLFDAQERYESFLLTFSKLEKRIKQYHLASYLGITTVTLSNLKKRIKN